MKYTLTEVELTLIKDVLAQAVIDSLEIAKNVKKSDARILKDYAISVGFLLNKIEDAKSITLEMKENELQDKSSDC